MATPEPLSPGADSPYDFEQTKDNLPIPPEFTEEVGPDGERKKESAFYFGVIAGIVVWALVVALTVVGCYLCKKKSQNVDA